jgi:hypothetical protein
MPAAMRDRSVDRPQAAHDLHPFLEDFLVVRKRDLERQILAPVITAAGGKIDAAAAQQVECGPLLGNPDGVMQWQHGHCRRQSDPPRPRRDIDEYEVRTGEHAQGREMVLADPNGIEAHLFGVNRLGEDVRDERVRVALVVVIVVIAQCKIAEFHFLLLRRGRMLLSGASPMVRNIAFYRATLIPRYRRPRARGCQENPADKQIPLHSSVRSFNSP